MDGNGNGPRVHSPDTNALVYVTEPFSVVHAVDVVNRVSVPGTPAVVGAGEPVEDGLAPNERLAVGEEVPLAGAGEMDGDAPCDSAAVGDGVLPGVRDGLGEPPSPHSDVA